VGDKTALVVIDTQVGMLETPGLPPVPNGEQVLENIEGLKIVAHHSEVMDNGFAEVASSAEIPFREPVEA